MTPPVIRAYRPADDAALSAFDERVVTDHALHRCGIGTALMQRIEDACAHDRAFTSANESNAPMRALLARLGYQASGWDRESRSRRP